MPSERVLDLVDRLRGIYTLPVNDGAGLLDGSDVFKRTFGVPPIRYEAADMIERLRAGGDVDSHDLVLRLSEPADPLGSGAPYVVPIHAEAIKEIARLQMEQGKP
jgi:hypothetical protein